MEDSLTIHRRRQERKHECRELAANACYSVTLIIVVLVLLRPVMVAQILRRAEAYSTVGLPDESRRQCDKALLIDNENSQAWRRLALIHLATGDREQAYSAYLRATQADNANVPAHFELGMMYVADGLYASAVPCFEQVRALGPEKSRSARQGSPSYHRDSLDMLALCYEKTGDPTKMEFTLEELRIFYPGYGNAEERLARLKRDHPRQR